MSIVRAAMAFAVALLLSSFASLSHAVPTSFYKCALNYDDVINTNDTLFAPKPGPGDVFVCSVEKYRLDNNSDVGTVVLKVEQNITGGAEKTISMLYWRPKPGFLSWDGSTKVFEQSEWPDLSKLPKDSLLLIAAHRSKNDQENQYDGIAHDVVELTGPHDPLIEQAQLIVKLRDAKSVADLKSQCAQILDARAGTCAMQAAGYAIVQHLALVDPDGGAPLALQRLKSPDIISRAELKLQLQFLDAYFRKAPRSAALRQNVVDSMLPILTAIEDMEPNATALEARPCFDAIHLLAAAVQSDELHPLSISPLRRAALAGILDSLRNEKSTESQRDIKSIEGWLQVAPVGFVYPHNLRE